MVESGSYHEKEDMQRPFDLPLKHQEMVFIYSFYDPFVDYMKSLRTSNE
jgi:hypothetical protein